MEENTQTMLLARGRVRHLGGLKLGTVAIIVFDRRDLLVIGDVEVVIEVAAQRGDPRERPAVALLIGIELGKRRARYHHERGVAFAQQAEIAKGVGVAGAART